MGALKKVSKDYIEETTEEQRKAIDDALKDADRYKDNDALMSLDPDKLKEANSLVTDEMYARMEDEIKSLFSSDQKFIKDYSSSDGKEIFTISAKNLDYAINNITVVKNGYERPYREVYGLTGREVTEDNKKIIAAQLIHNITTGDLANGYLDGSMQFKLFGKGTPSYGITPETNIEPALFKLPNSKEMVDEVKEPAPLKWYQRWGGVIQRAFGIDGAARKALDKYDADMANFNAYKTVKENNQSNLGTEFEEREEASEKRRQAYAAKEDYEPVWLQEKHKLETDMSYIIPGKTDPQFIQDKLKKYDELKKGIENLPNKDYGKAQFEFTEGVYKNLQSKIEKYNKSRVKMGKEERDELLNEGKKDISKTSKVKTKTVSKDKSFE